MFHEAADPAAVTVQLPIEGDGHPCRLEPQAVAVQPDRNHLGDLCRTDLRLEAARRELADREPHLEQVARGEGSGPGAPYLLGAVLGAVRRRRT